MLAVKNPPANAGDIRDVGSTPGPGRSPGGGHGNPLQYSCLKKPINRGTWWATVQGVANSWTRLMQLQCNMKTFSASLGCCLSHRTSQDGKMQHVPRLLALTPCSENSSNVHDGKIKILKKYKQNKTCKRS